VGAPLDAVVQSKKTLDSLSRALGSLGTTTTTAATTTTKTTPACLRPAVGENGSSPTLTVFVYGATGYTGQLICRHVAAMPGLRVVPAGRSAPKLASLARDLQHLGAAIAPAVCLDLGDASAIDAALEGVGVVVHCAGPFATTFEPMVAACVRNRVHYVDINGEIAVIEAIAQRFGQQAKERGVMLLPAAGFDVVPSDTLSKLLADAFRKKYPHDDDDDDGDGDGGKVSSGEGNLTRGQDECGDVHLDIYFHFNEAGALISRGTGNVMKGGKRGVSVTRRDGRILESQAKAVPVRERRKCNFGPAAGGKEMTVKPANMADVASAYYSTGIGNIACFMSDVASMNQLKCVLTPFSETSDTRNTKGQPIGPSAAENDTGKAFLFGSVYRAEGAELVTGRLECPAPYKVTYLAVGHILQQVAAGKVAAGFQTPTTAYGEAFLDACDMTWQLESRN